MIKSLLVANRGEIACRIFRTARRLGVRTIAVYSDADAGARHVREADEAFRIGPAAARESYLSIERILEAARLAGAEAIHPGYGFLSENAKFAQACVDAGVLFVGPPAAAIAAMGSKIVAKARMRAAGVPVLPGYEGARQDLDALESAALELGLPLIIKPAAGGGGKGMRIVREKSEIAPALAGARRLAESAFGDSALLLERYLPAPRHVEVQVFADTQGHFVHLGDRDCSIQRRHQKLIEEAPAPAIPAEIHSRLRAAALLVAREIGYVSAGTVEFLFDGREFYFMEMNTRLQVEHTVTEAITGLDLVEWQLRVASGEPLPLTQEEIRLQGHAIEARVCAEDPDRDFLPSAGDLRLLEWPSGESIRVDAGFTTGDAVPATYDSLLGKVVAWAPERSQAAARLSSALERIYCVGVQTNDRWLSRVLRDPRFLGVRHSIAFLQESGADFAGPREIDAPVLALAALAAHATSAGQGDSPAACGAAGIGGAAGFAGGPAGLGGGGVRVAGGAAGVARDGPRGAAGLARSPSGARDRASLSDPARAPNGSLPWSPWDALDGFAPNLPARVSYHLTWHGHPHPVDLTFVRGQPTEVAINAPAPSAVSAPSAHTGPSAMTAPLGGTAPSPESASPARRAPAAVSGSAAATAPSGASAPFAPTAPLPTSVSLSTPLALSEIAISDGVVIASVAGVRRQARYLRNGAHLHLWTADQHIELLIEDPRLKEFSASAAQGGLTTPLPGVVAAVSTKVGQAVKAGDVLMVIEAMKMEHSIRAPHDGVVKLIHFRRGDRVPEGSELLELAPAAAT